MPRNTESLNDEIKEQARLVMENRSFKEKVKYFFYYNKALLIVIGIIAIAIGSIVLTIVNQKEVLFQGIVVNGDLTADYNDFWNNYVSSKQYDHKKQEYAFDPYYAVNISSPTTYEQTTYEKVILMGQSGALDVVLCDESFLAILNELGFEHDLSLVLSDEEMEKWGDYALWYDSPGDTYEGEELVAIDISEFAKVKKLNMFPDKKGYYLMVVDCPHQEEAMDFLRYLDTP